MTHVVTGSKGFLGRHLMAALPGAVGLDLPELDIRLPASREGDTFDAYLSDMAPTPSTVWHLAALNGSTQGFYDRPWDVLDVQIRGTLNVIDACVANGVKTLVLFSSSEVFQDAPVVPTPEKVPFSIPDPHNPRYSYAASKQAAEMLAWYSAIPRVIVIRPFNIFGPGQGPGHAVPDLIAKALAADVNATISVPGDERCVRAFCYVEDFIRDVLEIHRHHEGDERTREVYHVGSEQHTTIGRLAEEIAEACGRPDVFFAFGSNPPGGTMLRRPDLTKMRSIGWLPGASRQQGLTKTIAWHREQKK